MTEKNIGYTLLVLGITAMTFALIAIISVIMGKAAVPTIINLQSQKTATMHEPTQPKQTLDQNNGTDQLNQLTNLLGKNGRPNLGATSPIPQMQFFDPTMFEGILNTTVYYLVMQFVLGFGYKIAYLGTQLIRPIKVIQKSNV
ncbi:hypothetical protein KC726_03050 [Candidatus Woesebacteria bacterium]|nr:hypothetical protein [Candidatus Woesebacteria bacterium]